MNVLAQFVEQFRQVWVNATVAQRAVLLGAVAAVVLGLASVVFMTGRGDMAVLYSGLQEADAGEVVAYLRENNISYRVSEDGRTVYVTRQRVAETRLDLANAGLPHGGNVGFELFDRSEFGITDFAQKVNFKRATEGELARTINQMRGVRFSRVQLVLPEKRLFARDQEEPSASVFLSLESGGALDRRQVAAIQHLVASAVEGLSPGNITITDQYANALAAPSDPASAAVLTATQLEVRRAVERSLEQKVQSMLDRVVGPGHSAVAVTAEIDFDRVERTEERYDPESQVIRSEERQSEKSTTGGSDGGGVAGLTANLPTATNLTAGSVGGTSKKSETTLTNYEINKTVEHVVETPGTLTGLSVSAVVDGTYQTNDAGEKTYQARPDEEMANLQRLVLAAVGHEAISPQVEVLNVPLDTSVQDAERLASEEARTARLYELGVTIVKYVLIAVVALVAFNVLRTVLGRMAAATARRPLERGEEGAEGAPGARLDLMAGPATDTETRAAQLQQLSQERPEEVAALVKSWMAE